MAQATTSLFDLSDIQILLPPRGSTVPTCIDAQGRIQVLVVNRFHHHCSAELRYFTPGSGPGSLIDSQDLAQVGTTDNYQAFLNAGPISGPQVVNNRCIDVQDLALGEGEQYPIRVADCGSGSGSQQIEISLAKAISKQVATLWKPDTPIPVAMMLTLDSPVRPGRCSNCDQLNRPTLLTHSQDASYVCSWFSQPLSFCSEGAEPGWWVLQRTDGRTWTLQLRYQDESVVKYQLTTSQDGDCKLPIQLVREGDGGAECKNWPRTVTIAPA